MGAALSGISQAWAEKRPSRSDRPEFLSSARSKGGFHRCRLGQQELLCLLPGGWLPDPVGPFCDKLDPPAPLSNRFRFEGCAGSHRKEKATSKRPLRSGGGRNEKCRCRGGRLPFSMNPLLPLAAHQSAVAGNRTDNRLDVPGHVPERILRSGCRVDRAGHWPKGKCSNLLRNGFVVGKSSLLEKSSVRQFANGTPKVESQCSGTPSSTSSALV